MKIVIQKDFYACVGRVWVEAPMSCLCRISFLALSDTANPQVGGCVFSLNNNYNYSHFPNEMKAMKGTVIP